MKRGKAKKLREVIEQASVSLPDEDALEAVELFPVWQANHQYAAADRVRWLDKLYRCVQGHLSQAGWAPDSVPALWTEVAKPGEIPVWRQPTGAQDAYRLGDKVRYPDESGHVWVSTIDYNTYQPGIYGWTEQ